MGNKIFHFIIILSLLVLINFLRRNINKPSVEIKRQESAHNFDQHFLRFIGFSQKRLLATSIYGQTLLFSDNDHYSGALGKNWMYLRFLSSLELDPKFYDAALHGGLYTSIIKNDPTSGNTIFLLGLKNYPNDFGLNFYLGFNYQFDLKDNNKAVYYYSRILGTQEQIKKMPLLGSMVATILNDSVVPETQKLQIAQKLREMHESLQHLPELREKILKKLEDLNF